MTAYVFPRSRILHSIVAVNALGEVTKQTRPNLIGFEPSLILILFWPRSLVRGFIALRLSGLRFPCADKSVFAASKYRLGLRSTLLVVGRIEELARGRIPVRPDRWNVQPPRRERQEAATGSLGRIARMGLR